jgi:hypothetical protein
MPEPQHDPTPIDGEAHAEWGVLNLLIDPEEQRPWSVEEIIRERGDRLEALDAIDRLHATGLVHRIPANDGEFVFATRAAIRFSQIAG